MGIYLCNIQQMQSTQRTAKFRQFETLLFFFSLKKKHTMVNFAGYVINI